MNHHLTPTVIPFFGACFALTSFQIGINVGEDQSGTLGGIEPRIKWSTSGEVAGIDVEVGFADTTSTMVVEAFTLHVKTYLFRFLLLRLC
jgi:hypothetical protein